MSDAATEVGGRDELAGRELVVMTAQGSHRFDLPRAGTVTIGRGEGQDIRVEDASISRAHAVLHVGGTVQLEDKGSANGTYLHGARLEPGRRADLSTGEFFELGSVVCAVRGAAGAVVAPEPAELVIAAPAMRKLHELVDRVATGGVHVLLLGESGVGKEVIAQRLHERSSRASGPMVKLNCAAFPEALLESELFGHEKGAFTGAERRRIGLLEAGDGGTVFLDEIGELTPGAQAKLLRVLEDKKLRRVGGVDEIAIDVVFVSATNRDLAAESAAGRFRNDLYYRLNGFTITIPPLRERKEEIAPLARAFAAAAARRIGLRGTPVLAPEVIARLESQPWPGNIRELRNAIDRAIVLAGDDPIAPDHFEAAVAPVLAFSPGDIPADLTDDERADRARIIEVLAAEVGNQTRAAEVLGISRRWLTTKMERYRIPRPRKR